MKMKSICIVLVAGLAVLGCRKASEKRAQRFDRILAEVKSMPPSEVDALFDEATAGKKSTWEEMKTLTVTLPSGMEVTLEEIQSAVMVIIVARGNPNAGTWQDDPENWNRAFGEDPPEDVSVVHSYYWESDHFTHEYIYYFEVRASSQWLEAFLKKQEVEPVAPENAQGYEVHDDQTPDWFVPDPVDSYDVWDAPGYRGSIWVNKSNGHIFFYGSQL